MGDLEQRVADIVEPCGDCSRSVALAAARAIIPMVQAATLELAAEALRAEIVGHVHGGDASLGAQLAADWLRQRANQVNGGGNG